MCLFGDDTGCDSPVPRGGPSGGCGSPGSGSTAWLPESHTRLFKPVGVWHPLGFGAGCPGFLLGGAVLAADGVCYQLQGGMRSAGS